MNVRTEKTYLEICLPDDRIEELAQRARARGYKDLEQYILGLIDHDLEPAPAKK